MSTHAAKIGARWTAQAVIAGAIWIGAFLAWGWVVGF
jgi:hypothetical protein